MKTRNFKWVIAATLICGASVFSSCTNSDDNPTPPAKKNRAAFIEHTRANLKDLAENLNFSSWMGINRLNNSFNEHILTNPEFEKTISTLFSQTIQQTIQPVEEGSELAQLGYRTYAVIDFTEFNYRFTQNEDNTGFDVEPAEDFQLIFKHIPPRKPMDGMGPEGEGRPEGPGDDMPRNELESLVLKASGSAVEMIDTRISTEEMAVIVRFPTNFDFSLGMLTQEGTIDPLVTGTFQNIFESRGNSSYINMRTDAWNLVGTLQANSRPPREGEGSQGEDRPRPASEPKEDSASLKFAIGQDPATHEAGILFSFTHNQRDIIQLSGVMKNTNGPTDYSEFSSATSMSEAFTAIMAGNSIESATITMLNDLTTSLKVSDCGEVLNLQHQMARARRNYADEATIEQYTQQLNQLVSARMTCAGVNQVIPMQLKTIKFGVDYWSVPALNFGDENGYVAITDMLDPESIQYMINIADHAAEPMQESIITVRQLIQYIQMLTGTYQQNQKQ